MNTHPSRGSPNGTKKADTTLATAKTKKAHDQPAIRHTLDAITG